MAAQNTATTAAAAADPPGSPTGRQWLALSVLVLSQLAVWLDNTVLNVALKTLADPDEGLGASPNQLQWSISSYTLVFAVLLFTGGVLADRYGHRRLLLTGMLVFGAASVWAAYAGSADELIVARGVMGLGSALIMPATLALIAQVFDERHRATAIAIWSGSSGIAIATGPMLSGALLDHFWWGSVFLVNVPIVVLCAVGSFLYLPGVVTKVRKKFDPLGVLFSTAGLFAVVWGVIEGGHRGDWSGPAVLGSLAGGAVLVIVFVVIELRVSSPGFDVRLFRDVRFTGASVAIMLTFFGVNGSMYYTSFYLQGVHRQTPLECGLSIAPVALGVLLGAPLSARLVRRHGVRSVVTCAMLIATAGFFGYVFLDEHTGLGLFWVFLVLQGLGMGAAIAPTTEAIMSVLPPDRTGAGSAVNNSMRQIGGVLGVAVLGSVLAGVYRDEITPRLSDLPADSAAAAEESPEATRLLAQRLSLPRLADFADQGFVHAMHVAAVVGAAVALVGAAVIWWTFRRPTAPGQPAEQG
ncbi:MFS transporter [Streptomyces sparsogenes]|uniref:Drug resistance transporter, EmrB/QacA subfamily protein n=1 Tax=Streptomyces sparsogenes DSM 40356 TaxID=1331668 RepID=A0A1R1S6C2_9ACTN|nr:MFS transporter [Streptomyces sparsogenes]OMI33865.1 drug resistance transporter, EmrB/QacA subfamily protein [Streptomyces sparsogenes DSM 40356]